MALPIFDKDIAFVSKLDDYPNDVGGLSAEELKATFDKAALELQDYINNQLIPELVTELRKAEMGIPSEGKFNGTDLELGSVTGDKLAYKTVTQDKIGEKAVGSTEINDGAITEDKIALRAISGAKIKEKAIGSEHIAEDAVQAASIRDGSITNTKIVSKSISRDKLTPGAAYRVLSATLPPSGWSVGMQTVAVNGITATDTFIVSPAIASHNAWCEAGVYCSGAATGSLTFSCEDAPIVALNAVITVLT